MSAAASRDPCLSFCVSLCESLNNLVYMLALICGGDLFSFLIVQVPEFAGERDMRVNSHLLSQMTAKLDLI